jgi:putative tributyrin esterase
MVRRASASQAKSPRPSQSLRVSTLRPPRQREYNACPDPAGWESTMRMKWPALALPLLIMTLAWRAPAKDYETVEMAASHLGGMTVGFNIILPRDYAISERRYPVLYLLHGYTDHYPAWVSYTNLTQYARGFQQIIVMPEGDNGFYTNSYADANLAWEDFVILDLIPYVDGHYRTVASRQGRAIAGLSMGGYGALKLGLKYPRMFSAVASMSGATAAARPMREAIDDEVFRKLVESVFGPTDNPDRAQNDPFELVAKVPRDELPQLYISIGSEDFLLEENREFVRLLAKLKIPYEYHEVPGKHEWAVWDREIQVILAHQAPVIGSR